MWEMETVRSGNLSDSGEAMWLVQGQQEVTNRVWTNLELRFPDFSWYSTCVSAFCSSVSVYRYHLLLLLWGAHRLPQVGLVRRVLFPQKGRCYYSAHSCLPPEVSPESFFLFFVKTSKHGEILYFLLFYQPTSQWLFLSRGKRGHLNLGLLLSLLT